MALDRIDIAILEALQKDGRMPNAAKLQGGLAPYIERGTATSRPHPALRPAADAEGPRLVDALADLAVDLLRR